MGRHCPCSVAGQLTWAQWHRCRCTVLQRPFLRDQCFTHLYWIRDKSVPNMELCGHLAGAIRSISTALKLLILVWDSRWSIIFGIVSTWSVDPLLMYHAGTGLFQTVATPLSVMTFWTTRQSQCDLSKKQREKAFSCDLLTVLTTALDCFLSCFGQKEKPKNKPTLNAAPFLEYPLFALSWCEMDEPCWEVQSGSVLNVQTSPENHHKIFDISDTKSDQTIVVKFFVTWSMIFLWDQETFGWPISAKYKELFRCVFFHAITQDG